MRLLLLTPPYAGTVGALGALGTPSTLARHLGLPLIGVGDLFRLHYQHDCDFGKSLKAHVDLGVNVPDPETIDMLLLRLAGRDTAGGFVLHNYPRTVTQAALLESALADRDQAIDAVLQIEFSDDDVERQFANDSEFSRDRLCGNASAVAALREHFTAEWTTIAGVYDSDLMDQRAVEAVAELMANHGGVREHVLAERLLRHRVASGSSVARVSLATFLAWQKAPADLDEAETLLREAAEADTPGARNFLGLLLSEAGRDDEASGHFLMAIAAGDLTAMTNYADILHRNGKDAEAFTLIRRAAELGDEFAFFIVQRNLDADSEPYQAMEAAFRAARPDAESRLFCMRPTDWRLDLQPG